MKEPLILLTNDDGIRAIGLRILASHLAELGRVMVVAPQGAMSAVSHTITLHKPLRIKEVKADWYACSGTPTDCIYLGLHAICQTHKPAIVVSGINRGPNLGDDVFYSGTVAGAMEGRLLGYPALAVSQVMSVDKEYEATTLQDADFEAAAKLATEITGKILDRGLPDEVLLNLNVPPQYDPSKGVKVVRLGRRHYGESFSRRRDPSGRPYYWIGGFDVGRDAIPGTDVFEIDNGYATLTPVSCNLTNIEALASIERWEVGALARTNPNDE